jgi:hypothetical protein
VNVKSEKQSKEKICRRYIKAMENGEPLAILLTFIVVITIVLTGIKANDMKKWYNDISIYSDIISEKPLIRCGNAIDDMITPDNYQAFKVGDQEIIRIHYSKDTFRDFHPSDCSIIRYDLNKDLEISKIKETISVLSSKVKSLQEKVKNEKKRADRLEAEKAQIRKDYKLPTFTELEKLYSEFKTKKGADFESWVGKLKRQEIGKLEKARAETYKLAQSSDDCYTEAMESTNPKAYDWWLAGKCDKVRTLKD